MDTSPRLVSFAINNTLGEIDGVSQVQRIRAASPLPAEEVRNILERDLGLKTMASAEELTQERAARVCARLGITRADLGFGMARLAAYRLVPGAREAVALLAGTGLPVVTISNASVFSLNDGAMRPVSDGLVPYLTAMHHSCVMGVAKPDPQIFRAAAAEHGIAAQDLVHIGDSWVYDIAPALAAGARAAWVNSRRAPQGGEAVPPGRLIEASNVLQAAAVVRACWLDGIVATDER